MEETWFAHWKQAPDAIALVRSTVGDCLVRHKPSTGFPCPKCIEMRLEEWGILETPEIEVGTLDLPDTIDDALTPEPAYSKSACFPVVCVSEDGPSLHTGLAVPDCPVCGDVQRGPAPADRLLSETSLMDGLLGVLSGSFTTGPDSPGHVCYSAATNLAVPRGEAALGASGQGSNAEEALSRLLGESAERYAALRPRAADLRSSSINKLKDNAPPAKLLNRYLPEQLYRTHFEQLKDDTELMWVRGRCLESGADRFVPACYVYLTRPWDEPKLDRMSSTGLAAHRDLASARHAALLEIIERFTMTLAWHSGALGVQLPRELLPRRVINLLERNAAEKINLALIAASLPPKIPVVLAVTFGNMFPYVTVGSAAATDVSAASAKATTEALVQWEHFHRNAESFSAPTDLGLHATTDAHPLWYTTKKRSRWLLEQFLATPVAPLSSLRRLDVPTMSVLEKAQRIAPELIEVDITTPDCAWCGYRVVRIVAPGLPLFGFGKLSAPGLDLERFGTTERAEPHPYG